MADEDYCKKCGTPLYGCPACSKKQESLDETRARFRREFAELLDSHFAEVSLRGEEFKATLFNAFAVGAGHGHDVKFRDDRK